MSLLTVLTDDTPTRPATQPERPFRSEPPAGEKRQARVERVALAALLLLYFISASGFALATPYGEAPDENGHLLYIEHIVRFGTLPEIKAHPYAYEAIQMPLYYVIGAGFVAVGRSLTGKSLDKPLAPLVRHNPEHNLDGTVAQVFLHPAEERWPLTVYMLRGLSILMGAGVIILTYATARALVPRPAPPWVALIAAGFAALIPQFNFIRGSISNENAAALTGALLVWLLTLHLTQLYSARRVVWIGIVCGLGALSKLLVVPLIAPALWVLWVRRDGEWGRMGRDLLKVGALIAAVAGWLFIYRWVVYGDPLAQEAAHEMLTHRSPFRLEQFFWFDEPFRSVLWKSFWGSYGWQSIWLPDWLYHAALGVTLLAIGGGAYLLIRRALTRAQSHACAMMLMAALLVYSVVVVVSTDQIIWQGREMFPALSSICILFGLGLAGVLSGPAALQPSAGTSRWRWRQLVTAGIVSALVIVLFALNLYSVLWLVLPALNT